MTTWHNWAGNQAAHPALIAQPASRDELVQLVRSAQAAGHTLRVVGAGHSFTPLCATGGVLVSLDRMQGLIEADPATHTACIQAGTRIFQLGPMLRAHDLGLANQGDIDRQALAGAVSTGTHGTGLAYGSFSTTVREARLVLASGEIVTCSEAHEPELFKAAQLGLGALGMLADLTLQLVPAYRLHARSWPAPFEVAMGELHQQVHANDHFEFFWVPALDTCAMKALNPTEAPIQAAHPGAPAAPGTIERYLVPEHVDWSDRVYPSDRDVRFVEMEFAVPLADGPACFGAIRDLIQTRHTGVRWVVEYRTQRADDVWLSPAYGRDVATISIHEPPDRPYQAFFDDAEAIFRSFGGRPHWAKLHTHTARDFERLYPRWNDFLAVRERFDPGGMFLNEHLRGLFGL
ncbi:MAG TPA: D-arabinono-1,4-lactone oxidase [Roseiflexaceae bacterium]|nr:D-arabinono-1,4-lactone oxidase [Roseiflexaceae bacterium]